MQISVFESPQLQGVILALAGMDRELAAQLRKATKTVTAGEWSRALAAEASTEQERRVIVNTARVAVSNTNIRLRAGQLSKNLSGGAKLYELTPGVEFGGIQRPIHSTSSKGKAYTRRRGQGFRRRNKTGYVAYPAAAKIIPRIAALWVATTVRTLHEAIEKGTG